MCAALFRPCHSPLPAPSSQPGETGLAFFLLTCKSHLFSFVAWYLAWVCAQISISWVNGYVKQTILTHRFLMNGPTERQIVRLPQYKQPSLPEVRYFFSGQDFWRGGVSAGPGTRGSVLFRQRQGRAWQGGWRCWLGGWIYRPVWSICTQPGFINSELGAIIFLA